MKKYPSDLTDAQWLNITKLLDEKMLQRKRRWELRSIFDALFYVVKGGIQWRMLPNNFAPWQTVYFYFRQWKKQGLLQRIYQALHEKIRLKAGKQASPSLGIIDSQSVKTSLAGGSRGFDNAKKTKGRKRHIAVDTLGFIIALVVHRADIAERKGAKFLFQRIAKFRINFPRLIKFLVDGGYSGDEFAFWVRSTFKSFQWTVEVVKKLPGIKQFVVLPKRWIVERTFGWFEGSRRLAKDFERLPRSSETMIHLTMIKIALQRLSK